VVTNSRISFVDLVRDVGVSKFAVILRRRMGTSA
jgi:hypothetical protein